jgi:hypothetical protein
METAALVRRFGIAIPTSNIEFAGISRIADSLWLGDMVDVNCQDGDWRRAKRLGTRVSRKGSYTRLERRCLGINKAHPLSIINDHDDAMDAE